MKIEDYDLSDEDKIKIFLESHSDSLYSAKDLSDNLNISQGMINQLLNELHIPRIEKSSKRIFYFSEKATELIQKIVKKREKEIKCQK